MAIDTQAYYYLVDPVAQFENNSGKPIVGGWCCVYESGTDNKVITLQEFDGTKNPFKVPLGSDGRCVMLVDIGKRYDLYVYDSFGNLAVSRLNILPLTTGDITVQGLTKVYHDSTTLSGDGTLTSPLTVIGGGGLSTVVTEWPVVGNGSQENPVTIEDITLLAHDDTLTSYDAEIEGKKSLVLGVNGDWFESATSGFQEKSDMSNYVTNQTFIDNNNSLNSKIDTKLDTTAFSEVSGSFALSADVDNALAGKQDTLTDYTPNTWNTVTNKLDTTAFSEVSGSFLTAHQSLEGYATESFVTNITNNKLDTSVYSSTSGDFALKSEIPSLDGYATEQWVENKNYLVSDDISGKADKSDLSNYYPISGGNLNGKLAASGTGSAASAQAAVIYAKVTNTSTNNQAGLGTNGSVWAGDYTNATSQTIGVRRKVGDKKLAGRFQLYSDGNVSFQQIENSGTDSIICQLQYGNTTSGNNWGTMTFGDETKHIAYTEDLSNDFMETSKLEYNADNLISGYNGSAFAGQGGEDIATKTWVNDQGFLTAHQSLDGYATESWVSSQGYAHSSDIPTNVSQLNNDAGYLTEHQSLTAYALKSEIPVIGTIEV